MSVLELKTGRDIGYFFKVGMGKAQEPYFQRGIWFRISSSMPKALRKNSAGLNTSSAYFYSCMVPKCCPEATRTEVSTCTHLLIEKDALSGVGS